MFISRDAKRRREGAGGEQQLQEDSANTKASERWNIYIFVYQYCSIEHMYGHVGRLEMGRGFESMPKLLTSINNEGNGGSGRKLNCECRIPTSDCTVWRCSLIIMADLFLMFSAPLAKMDELTARPVWDFVTDSGADDDSVSKADVVGYGCLSISFCAMFI